MGTLSELLAERRALDAQIEEAKTAIARSGESVVIDGETIDSTVNVEGELANPKDDAFLFTYEKAENGDIKNVGELTYKQLVDRFAQEATTILNQAIAAGETSVENIQEALTVALAAIGQDNASGARGQAIAAINALYSAIAEAITGANSAWNSQVSTDKSAWASQVSADLQSLSTALSDALAAIGESNSAGARGAAIDAINTALQNALASIGQSDTAGARGEAITAITTALNNALAAIGQSDSEGARKAALDSINAKATEVNTALDQKLSSANTIIDEKVQTATEKATAAEDAAAAAAQSAKEAEEAANSPLATPEVAGRSKLYNNLDGYNTDGSVDQNTIHKAFDEFQASMKQTLPSPEVEYVKAATGDYGTFTLKTNYSSAFGSVKVVMTPSSADPSASDTEITVGGTTVSANDNWQITAIQTDPDSIYSDSLTAVIGVTDLKVQTPIINYDDSTYTITLTCASQGAAIHYTIDGSSVSAASPVYNGAISIDESVTIQVLAVKDGIQNSNTVSKVCNVARILCTSFPIEGHDGTRLTPSTDPLNLVTETITQEPVPEIPGTQEGSSPYDQYTPWQKKRRNFVSGAPDAWDGDSGFSTTEKDTMVYYPDCYIKFVVSSDVEYFYISDKPYEGFEQAKWAEKYKAAYETSNNNESKSGKSVQVNQSITTMRTNANNKGTGWGILDAVMHSADQWLFMVEYASRDVQEKIGQGISGDSSKHSTGETDVLTYHTGRCSGTDTISAVRYRWSENLWGNVYEWCDGVVSGASGIIYVTDNPDVYGEDYSNAGYTQFTTQVSTNSSWYAVDKFSHNENANWCQFIPLTANDDRDNSAAPDYVYKTSNSNYFLVVSGGWDDGSGCGLFCFSLSRSASLTYSSIGSRLTYREAA